MEHQRCCDLVFLGNRSAADFHDALGLRDFDAGLEELYLPFLLGVRLLCHCSYLVLLKEPGPLAKAASPPFALMKSRHRA